MLLIRDVMYCKPGQVRAMVDKFKAMEKVMKKAGPRNRMRIMTDVCGERYWTVVVESEVQSIDAYTEMTRKSMTDKNLQKAMKGYHDLVVQGRREIYTIEN